MFEKLASNKLEEYNKNGLTYWKEAFAADSRSSIHSYLKSLEDRNNDLSVRSDIPQSYDMDHSRLIKETASVSHYSFVGH